MRDDNKRFRDFLGVTKFHEAGYTGKRSLVASGEDFVTYHGVNDHAFQTYSIFKEIAPDATVIYLPIATTGGAEFINTSIPKILERKVDVFWASLSPSLDGTIFNEPLLPMIPFCTCIMAAGNGGTDSYNKALESDYIYGVGAYRLMADDNQIVPLGYSSVTDEVDFCAPTELWIVNGQFNGTSCSAPVLAGMAALVNDFFIDKTGKPLPSQMMYQFMKDHSTDLKTEGKDTKTGWGAPILPDPAGIDIWKYWEASEMAYTDKDKIPTYAADSVALLTNLGIMQGNAKGEFMPAVTVDRSQLAVALANLYKKVAANE